MKAVVLGFLNFLILFQSLAQAPKREMRGVWVATVQHIDWPSYRNFNAIKQQEEFLDLVESHKKTGINALFVQVRTAADAFYAKSMEPWSTYLSGFQGQAPRPYYDPMEFMLKACHQRGMEFHAWINLNRATMNGQSLLSAEHIARRHPDWFVRYQGQYLFNFGIPAARNYMVQLASKLVQDYPIDGLHLDDYFYPYPVKGQVFNDQASYLQYRLPGESLEDWRRRNINTLIEDLHHGIKAARTKVKFGISPFGIWRHQSNDAKGSNTRRGLQSYDDLYADTERWMREGWVDYLVPQLYWPTTHKSAPFEPLLAWWKSIPFRGHLYVGHGIYHLKSEWSAMEMQKQLGLVRSYPKVRGSVFYSSKHLQENAKGFRDTLRKASYAHPALVPAMPWIDSIAPAAPRVKRFQKKDGRLVLEWEAGPGAADGDKAAYFALYRFPSDAIDPLEQAQYLVYVGQAQEWSIELNELKESQGFVLTALDAMHNESRPSPVQWYYKKED